MDEFSKLLSEYRRPVERYVRFRIALPADAEDVLQEVYLTAYRRFGALRDRKAFLAWILAIARSRCLDYFRAKARQMELPMEMKEEILPAGTKHGRAPVSIVRETLSGLADHEKQILYLFYFENLRKTSLLINRYNRKYTILQIVSEKSMQLSVSPLRTTEPKLKTSALSKPNSIF